jgi:hypothetical protein
VQRQSGAARQWQWDQIRAAGYSCRTGRTLLCVESAGSFSLLVHLRPGFTRTRARRRARRRRGGSHVAHVERTYVRRPTTTHDVYCFYSVAHTGVHYSAERQREDRCAMFWWVLLAKEHTIINHAPSCPWLLHWLCYRGAVDDRSWARELDPPRCACWIVTQCLNLKSGKQCDRVHECKNCGFVDDE